ncbi:MAG: hypothetical protein DRP41_01515 [Thermodesulfobacteriota bacterium]|nr:MAG: hypothetical protein DRP41_01515 [Thermodesulfobacteriota bacterium]
MLRTENLTKRYSRLEAVKDVTLHIFRGEILTVLGPSGCGKTTLLRMIAGLERPDEGRVLIDGIEVSSPNKMVPPFKRKLSMIFQDLALWPHMTVKGNIKFVMEKNLTKDILREEIHEILEKVNLIGFNNRYPHQLSGGEKQRLAIARALASRPAYLLMDEPFSNLDLLLKEELQNVVIKLKKDSQIGIIYVTHNIDEALILANRIAIMNKGRIEQMGTKDELLSNPKNEFVKRFLRVK